MIFTDSNQQYDRLKQLTVTALVSDDHLMETLVLKGGNALFLVYGMSHRASLDLDFSMEGEFKGDVWLATSERIRQLLERRFSEDGLSIIDFRAEEQPPNVSDDLKQFWGGYRIEFKAIEKSVQAGLPRDSSLQSKNALTIGVGQQRTIRVDISKYELCDDRIERTIDGYSILVYSHRLIVVEKLRAICQQMPNYNKVVHRQDRSGRARDFYDILEVCRKFNLVPTQDLALLAKRVFDAKRVCWDSLRDIELHKQLYESDYASLVETLPVEGHVKPFDVYFGFATAFGDHLHSLGNV